MENKSRNKKQQKNSEHLLHFFMSKYADSFNRIYDDVEMK